VALFRLFFEPQSTRIVQLNRPLLPPPDPLSCECMVAEDGRGEVLPLFPIKTQAWLDPPFPSFFSLDGQMAA